MSGKSERHVKQVAINFAEVAKWSSTLKDGLYHMKKIAGNSAFSPMHPPLKTIEPKKPWKTGFLGERRVT